MGATTRALDRAARLADRQAHALGDEFRERRVSLGSSQAHVAAASRVSRTRYGLIERGRSTGLTLTELYAIAAVLGLTPSVRVFPDGAPIRDAAHATRLVRFLSLVRPSVTYRLEVPLPIVEGRAERRAWDAVLYRGTARCGVELEMRLRDIQAVLRRIDLKRRDDPMNVFVLLVADTRLNRRVVAEFSDLLVDLPRLRAGDLRDALAAGQLPATGLLLI
jgi:transcriptional regulator with XRE-family HTH domain